MIRRALVAAAPATTALVAFPAEPAAYVNLYRSHC
jgi:hypothetical protein